MIGTGLSGGLFAAAMVVAATVHVSGPDHPAPKAPAGSPAVTVSKPSSETLTPLFGQALPNVKGKTAGGDDAGGRVPSGALCGVRLRQGKTSTAGGITVTLSRELRPRDRNGRLNEGWRHEERESTMPKYLIQATYTAEGLKGVLRDGGTGRRQAVERMAESVGGRVEQMYFAFGDTDTYVILDLPSNAASAAVGLTISATGAVRTKTVVLLAPEEVDEATRMEVAYQPPGA
ncbi:GYD domain-containing protein [Nonomuraea sp. B5E05]|uniref:GYD domain-containing protein n=1 Tax=Nonomuraea sp. B5E05 TaxID=3153569 RepID=UPI003260B79D